MINFEIGQTSDGYYLYSDVEEVYLWHNFSIHGGPECKEYPNDGCFPFNVSYLSEERYKYGYYKTKKEAQKTLDEYKGKNNVHSIL